MLNINKFLIIANWKMSIPIDMSGYIDDIERSDFNCDLVLSVPYTHLKSVGDKLSKAKLGSQNVFNKTIGSFTGEISVNFLKDLNVKYCIVGHSERRALGETFENVIDKINILLNEEIIPIVCISLEKYNKDELLRLKHFDGRIVVAYEPLWAIGSGNAASIDNIIEALSYIKESINSKVIYGGSVNETNFKEIANIKEIDGLLIGGASLDKNKFKKILEGI